MEKSRFKLDLWGPVVAAIQTKPTFQLGRIRRLGYRDTWPGMRLIKMIITIYIYKNAFLLIKAWICIYGWVKKDKFNTCTCFDHSLSPHSTTQALICTKHNILSQKGIHPIISTKSTQNNEAGSSPAHVH